VTRVKELGPGDVTEEKTMNIDDQDDNSVAQHDDSSVAQQNSALAMLRTGNVSVPHTALSLSLTISDDMSLLTLYACPLLDGLCRFARPLCFQAGCRKRRLNLSYHLSRFILCSCIFVFDDLYLIDLVVTGLVLY